MKTLARFTRLVLALVIPMASWGSGARPTWADEPPPTPESPGRARAFEALAAKANGRQAVNVIVTLRAGFAPEGSLAGAQAVEAQRAGFARAQEAVSQALSGTPAVIRTFKSIPVMALRVDTAALNILRNSAWVEHIEEDVPERLTLAESTPLIGAAGTSGAWAAGYTGAGWTVAVLDSGVDKTHPFLAGKVVAEACFSNSGGVGGAVSLCPGGASSSTASGSGVNCSISGCDHGTHVAGIAAGKAYGSVTFSGVAPEAQIIAIQVFTRFNDAGSCSPAAPPCIATFPSDQIEALNYINTTLRLSFNIASVNMSLGGSISNPTTCPGNPREAPISTLRSVGIATVIASGNSGFTNGLASPACAPSAVSVGATQDSGPQVDTVAGFSNSAAYLSLLAPGQAINSSVPGGGFANFNGTSMATPHVAGAWAVLKQQAALTASVDTILQTLQNTGVSVTDSRNAITKKRIRLNAALSALTSLIHFAESNPFGLSEGVDLSGVFTLNLVNNMGIASTLTSPTLSTSNASLGYAGGSYPGTGGTCGGSLGAGQTCVIKLSFAPANTTPVTGTLTITYQDLVNVQRQVSIALSGVGTNVCPSNLLDNSRLEKLNVTWVQTDTVGGNALPMCTTGACSVGGYAPAGPYSGMGWGWFGGYTTTQTISNPIMFQTQRLTQTVTIPPGTATLQFNLHISRADLGTGITDTFRALINNTPVFTATAADAGLYPAFQLVRLDVGAFASQPATVAFSATTTTKGPIINFNLDDAALCAPAYYPIYLPSVSKN